jgi:predicted Zn-dependent peptidase
MENYQLYTLPNGIRVVNKQVKHTQIVHIGIMFDIGSRDEKPHQQGLAHFWEHNAFKGTENRTAIHIINRLEAFGGELNAYTTREKVCFHASILKEHAEKAIDLLTDIAFYSTFPEKHIEKEKGIILEEMAMYHDSPEDSIQDEFDVQLFENHPLGTNILGTAESVKGFGQTDLRTFITENLDTSKIVMSIVGNVSAGKVARLADKYLHRIPAQQPLRTRLSPPVYQASIKKVERAITQAHVAMGGRSYALSSEKRMPFFLLTNLLGGPSMNARLNLSIREKYGLVYSIDANYTPYIDTGYWGIYFGTEKKHLNKVFSLIHKEMKTLRDTSLSTNQLQKIKQQLMGQMAMAEEGNMSFMLMMAKCILDVGRIDSLSDIFKQIDTIQVDTLQAIAQEMFAEDTISYLTFLPER